MNKEKCKCSGKHGLYRGKCTDCNLELYFEKHKCPTITEIEATAAMEFLKEWLPENKSVPTDQYSVGYSDGFNYCRDTILINANKKGKYYERNKI